MSVQEKSSNNSRTLIVYYSLEGNTEYARVFDTSNSGKALTGLFF